MFVLIWTFGYLVNGAPMVQRVPPSPPMSLEDCQTAIVTDTARMHDWLRGALRQPLTFPVAVYGECKPVQRDATKRK